jgi:hypothetical protein
MFFLIRNWFYWLLMSLYQSTGNPAYLAALQTVPEQVCLEIEWDAEGRAHTTVHPTVACQ